MIAHLGAEAGAGVGGKNHVGGLVREVAVDALADQCAAAAAEETAALDLVTRETAIGEVGDVALRRVDVVTRRAGHVRRLKTLTPLQQLDLVAVNVQSVVRLRRRELQVVRQSVADGEREDRRLRNTDAAVAQRTQIQLTITW